MLQTNGLEQSMVSAVKAPPTAHQGHEGVGEHGPQRGDRQRHDHRQVRPGPLHLPGSRTAECGPTDAAVTLLSVLPHGTIARRVAVRPTPAEDVDVRTEQ